MSHPNSSPRAVRRAISACAVLLCLAAGAAFAQPTVNGLYYGDDDDELYQPYAESIGGSILYQYLDVPNQKLYIALVVSHSVNDTVCSPTRAYTTSAGWNPPRPCSQLVNSEFAEFIFECAPGSPNAWTWQQGFACANNTTNPPSDWVSDQTCNASAGTVAPPSIESSSSWVANINTYQAKATPGWNLYGTGAAGLEVGNWSSPDRDVSNNVNDIAEYPTFSVAPYDWEWSMVYEWSIQLGEGGTDCGDSPIYFIAGSSHHSPAKTGPENDVFEECEDNDPDCPLIFSDWGDLPEEIVEGVNRIYSTTDLNNGARHYLTVNGPYLGQDIQVEPDGQPTDDATGDGAEEDGVTANVTTAWIPLSTQSFDVEVSNAPSGALVGGWFDWNNDGVFDASEFESWPVSNGPNTLSLTVGADFNPQTDILFARFRIFSSGSAAPGGSLDWTDFGGLATDGEVEDYLYPPGTLPVTLNAFTSEGAPGGEITVRWQTASETDNVAFELWGQVDGEWRPLTDLIQSKSMNSGLPQSYQVRFTAPAGLSAVQLLDYDSKGRPERFGSYRLGETYGEFQRSRPIDWSGPRAERAERLRNLGFADTARRGGPEVAERRGGEAPAAARWKKLRSGAPVSGSDTRYHGASAITIETRKGPPPGQEPGGSTPAGAIQVEPGSMTHVAVTEPGIQRVTYEALRDGGLDLAGMNVK
ncbi:MAG TPA: GEVED domain-containing protein, partial [Thermoanaerobaculia bacterium]|nr:GEVED domain-containing protein [Thermoanaerobaculia bacterium]